MWSSFAVFILSLYIGLGEALPQRPSHSGLRDAIRPSREKLKEALANATAHLAEDYPFPYAYCIVDWTFGMDCQETMLNLMNQIKKWTGPSNCGSKNHDQKDKCLYQLLWHDDYYGYIEATHTTPDYEIADFIGIILDPASFGCRAMSYSFTGDPDEYLDDGRNYCNVMNLVQGSGLDTVPAYSRDSSNEICTQFTSTDCST